MHTPLLAAELRPAQITVQLAGARATRARPGSRHRARRPRPHGGADTLDRIALIDEVARVVEFFAGPLGAFVSGQALRVDGGAQTWAG